MSVKIDDRAVVPIGWVFGAFGTMITVTIIGAFWVSAVNFRLQRIEEKLGIPPLSASLTGEVLASEIPVKEKKQQ